MLLDIISWINAQLFVIGLLIFINEINNRRKINSKFNNVKLTKQYKDNIIREITQNNKVNLIVIVVIGTFKNHGVNMKMRDSLSIQKSFKTLKHNIPDLVIDDNVKFYHGSDDLIIVNRDDKDYDDIVNYVTDICEMDLDLNKCLIFQSGPLLASLYVSGKKKQDKIIIDSVNISLDCLISRLILNEKSYQLHAGIIMISMSVLTKALIYWFA